MVEAAYYSPVPPASFAFLALALSGAGLVVMALFFVYQMKASHDGKSRNVVTELGMATASSLLLGFGTFFFTLWAGIWV